MRNRARILATFFFLACLCPAQAVEAQELRSGRFHTSDGVELQYWEAGSGPLLVFVPGWTMPAWIWRPQLEHFATSHHVVALDPRGHGASEKATHGYTATRQSQDICELLTHLDDGPAVIIGWSIAGQHVLLCADGVGTEVVEAVVVVDWQITEEASREFAANRISRLQEDRQVFTRGFIEAIHRDPQPEYVEALTESVLSVPTNAAAIMTANWYFFGPHDLGPVLDRLARPALLVYSALGWAVAAAEQAREGWPGIPVEVIEETSHALFVDRPEEFNRVLSAFLSSLRRP
jgi:microsomal epoxide hydrolase